ncbi:MAG: DUF3179 domain-containing protein [OCS116 cluster bacterium]|nr:DUF3179 domain-containing protein [OCS116 cluster bacterium]
MHTKLKNTRFMAKGYTDIGNELPLRETVFGITLNGVSVAYPTSELSKKPNFTHQVGNQNFTIAYNVKTNQMSIKTEDGKNLPTQSHWWFGWKEFHPFTEIWRV